MRAFFISLLLLWPTLAMAGVVNVEFKFTPFVGDPNKSDKVETVAGKAMVYLNNVPLAEEGVEKKEVPVLFAEREIAPAVWLPAASCGAALRKGKNRIRIEFSPADPGVKYHAQLRWASVMDQTTVTEEGAGRVSETNQADEGVDAREASGRVVFEREFQADFAADLPWHHYPATKSLSDADRQALAGLVKERLAAFKPDFAAAYRILANNRNIDLAAARKAKCLDRGYAAGIRVDAQPPGQIDFIMTGNPEVIVQGKGGPLFSFRNQNAVEKIKEDEVQMCVIMLLSTLYPPRFAAVRSAAGKWELVY